MAPKGKIDKKPGKPSPTVKAKAKQTAKPEDPSDAKARLQSKIIAFRKLVETKKIKSPDMQLIKKHFTHVERISLFQMLKRQIGKEDVSIKEAWEELQKLGAGQGKMEKKNNILFDFLAKSPGKDGKPPWTQAILKEKGTITQGKTHTSKTAPLTRGELIQKHGYDETMDFIARGKYKETTDDHGDTLYLKTSAKFEETLSHGKEGERSRITR